MPAAAAPSNPPQDVPKHLPSADHDSETLLFLSQLLNGSNDANRVRHAVAQASRSNGESLEILARAAEIVGLRIQTYRQCIAPS
jgi:hypothetical protein